jgi:hypothetical protein
VDLGLYTVDTWGARVGAGATAPQYCTLNGVAKVVPAGELPFMAANEYICATLAGIIGLPVPPGVIVQSVSGEVGYVALRFGNASERPPPVIADHVAADEPDLCAGTLTFDCWIANDDRHQENLAYARGTWPFMVFDHSHAFFGEPGDPTRLHDVGRGFLPRLLAAHLPEATRYEEWLLRVQSIRPGVIGDLCEYLATRSILGQAEAQAARDFLIARQATLPDLLRHSLPTVQWN